RNREDRCDATKARRSLRAHRIGVAKHPLLRRPALPPTRRCGRRAGKEEEDASFDLERSPGSRRSPGQRPRPRGPAVGRARTRPRDGPQRLTPFLPSGAGGEPVTANWCRRHLFLLSFSTPMDDIHISRELYQAVERGELPREFLEEVQAEHLLARCPHCRAEAEAYAFGRTAGPSAWSRFLQVLSLLVPRWMAPAERELRGARRDFEELLALSREERGVRLARARSRFRSPGLVRLLLAESRRRLPGQPAEALHFAELAWKVANRNPAMPEFYELYVLATVGMANACRVRNEAARADELFALARQVMDKHGVTDPAVIARVDDLVGSRRKDQRRFPEAEKLLKRAAVLYGLARSPEDHARVLINLADTCCARGS